MSVCVIVGESVSVHLISGPPLPPLSAGAAGIWPMLPENHTEERRGEWGGGGTGAVPAGSPDVLSGAAVVTRSPLEALDSAGFWDGSGASRRLLTGKHTLD